MPYLFGSAGKGARAQAERYVGADCADVLVAALRRTGSKMDYTSVADFVDALPKVTGPVRAGDLYALDYVGYDDLPRAWDHIVALVEDRGPDGKPDGKPGPEDLVIDTGNADGLRWRRSPIKATCGFRSCARVDAFVDGALEALDDCRRHRAGDERRHEAAMRALLDVLLAAQVVPLPPRSSETRLPPLPTRALPDGAPARHG